MDRVRLARSYYEAVDAGDDDALAALLAPAFVHRRPDRTLDGRERFVAFMREERPVTDSTHVVDTVYRPAGGASTSEPAECADTDGMESGADSGLAVRGRLLDGSGDLLVGFVDVFRFEGEQVVELVTYTR